MSFQVLTDHIVNNVLFLSTLLPLLLLLQPTLFPNSLNLRICLLRSFDIRGVDESGGDEKEFFELFSERGRGRERRGGQGREAGGERWKKKGSEG
jgi:hypothetical protein